MKLMMLAILFLSANAMAYPFVYDCKSDFDYVLTVKSKTVVTIQIDGNSEKDSLKVDVAYANANPEKKSVRLKGSATTMGDGEEGYTVYVTLSKVMLTGSTYGYLNKNAYGPEGSYQESYKCKLKGSAAL